jgi:hypothetical protein
MKFSLIAYILICITLGLTIVSSLYKSGRSISAILGIVLILLVFVFYGIRWFGSSSGSTVAWPPVINTCPDYLVYYKRTVGTTQKDTCVDIIGMNRSGGSLMTWGTQYSATNPPPSDSSGDKFFFDKVYKPGMNATDIAKLCTAAMEKNLTWEGITNGDSCMYNASTTMIAGTNTPVANCPAS